jgi:uncharacterized protein (DUF58 family)
MDASASMRYGSGQLTKFDYGATIAASLATLLVGQQDPVGLALFDSKQRELIPPAATQAQLSRIIGQLETAKPDRETALGAVLQDLSERAKQRGLIVIISDLLTDLDALNEGFGRLQYRGHEVMVFHILDKDEIELPFKDLILFRDIEGSEELFAEPWAFRKAYQAAMEEFIAKMRDACGRRGIDYSLVRTDDDLSTSLSHYLHARERFGHTGQRGR